MDDKVDVVVSWSDYDSFIIIYDCRIHCLWNTLTIVITKLINDRRTVTLNYRRINSTGYRNMDCESRIKHGYNCTLLGRTMCVILTFFAALRLYCLDIWRYYFHVKCNCICVSFHPFDFHVCTYGMYTLFTMYALCCVICFWRIKIHTIF